MRTVVSVFEQIVSISYDVLERIYLSKRNKQGA